MGAYSRLGAYLFFSAFRMGASSRWVLIWGWALIRINTVCRDLKIERLTPISLTKMWQSISG